MRSLSHYRRWNRILWLDNFMSSYRLPDFPKPLSKCFNQAEELSVDTYPQVEDELELIRVTKGGPEADPTAPYRVQTPGTMMV